MTCRPAGYRVKAVLPAADKERHLIECFFNKIKHDRRIFSRLKNSLATTWVYCVLFRRSSGGGDMSTEPKPLL